MIKTKKKNLFSTSLLAKVAYIFLTPYFQFYHESTVWFGMSLNWVMCWWELGRTRRNIKCEERYSCLEHLEFAPENACFFLEVLAK